MRKHAGGHQVTLGDAFRQQAIGQVRPKETGTTGYDPQTGAELWNWVPDFSWREKGPLRTVASPVAWKDMIYYEGAGCPQCNQTGFHGRTAIGELLALSDKTRDMILAKRPSSEIRHHARQEGMTTLRESALDKIRQGLTTLKEINKVTFVE